MSMSKPSDLAQGSVQSSARVVFISYRRDDTAGYAGRLQDSLVDRRPAWDVFVDVGSISPGTKFDHVIEAAVGKSDVMLALIGPSWVGQGLSRLFDPADFVRREITAALAAGIPVVPVLLRDASLPSAASLPPELARVLGRQAFRLRDVSWRTDVDALVGSLERLNVDQPAAAQAPQPKPAMGTLLPPPPRSGVGERAARCCAGALTWYAAAAVLIVDEGASPQLIGGIAGAINAYLVTLSFERPIPPGLRWPFVLGLAVALGSIWQVVIPSLGEREMGAACAALVTGYFTVPWQAIRLRPAALRMPHRAWRCVMGSIAWCIAAIVGYSATQTVSQTVAPLLLGGAFGGAVNGFLVGRLAENGRWSWRTAIWTAVGFVCGAASWYMIAGVYTEPFLTAPIATGLVSGTVLALPLPAAEGPAIGTTWRSTVGALIFGVVGVLFVLSRDLIDSESWTIPVLATGVIAGAVNGLLVFARTLARRLFWIAAFAAGAGITWGLLERLYPESYTLYATLGSVYGGFIAHRAIGSSGGRSPL